MEKTTSKTNNVKFWNEVKSTLKGEGGKKAFPWVASGFVLIGFTLGVFVTTGVELISRMKTEDKEIETDFSSSKDCISKGGRYDEQEKKCYLVTEDRGEECTSNDDCQGYCLADENAELNSESKGTCSENYRLTGCIKYIDDGIVTSICFPE